MDWGPQLFLFAVAGGYLALRLCCHFTRYRADALEWEQNLFEATGVGLLLFLLVRAAVAPFEHTTTVVSLHSAVHQALPFSYSGSLVATLLLGLVIGLSVNLTVGREAAIRLAIENYGGELLKMLHAAARDASRVSLTMTNRKVYVGFVVVPPPLSPKHTEVVLLPTRSGYRDEKTLELHFTDLISAGIPRPAGAHREG